MVHQHHHHRHHERDFDEFLHKVGSAFGIDDSDDRKAAVRTETVYQTLPPTFTDKVAGYSTGKPGDPVPTILLDHSTTSHKPKHKATTTTEHSSKPTKHSATADLTGLPASIVPTTSIDPSNSQVLLASQTSDNTTPTSISSSITTPSSIPDSNSGGMTAGAKAGVAIGVIAVVAALLSLVFFCLRQRKKAEERQHVDDEKYNAAPAAFVPAGGPGSMRSIKTLSTAPRLDVRPTTAFFMPNRASQMQNANANANGGNGIQMASQNRSPGQSAWERPVGDQQNRANPFGNHAESIDPVNAAGPPLVDGVSATGVVMAAGVAGARSAQGPVRSTSRGQQNKYMGNAKNSAQSPFTDAARTDGNGAQNTPQQVHNTAVIPMPLAGVIEESTPVSPVPSTAGGAAGDAQLFRVHLDFSPSMPDELRVRAGEIVKLIKEFDDGWCMCVKDDLSAEGVLPRTCISNSPIAARRSPPNKATPGPFQNGQRRHSPPGPGPQNRNGPPMNPNGRNSPGPGRGPQYRPQQGRPQQGRPQQQGRPMSPAMANNGRNSPGPGYGPGPGPQYRPHPQQQQPRPASPAMSTHSNAPRNNNPQPRPASPTSPLGSVSSSSAGTVTSANRAAAVPLPGSPALPQTPVIPEVTITAPVERKPVGRKPVPGQAM